MNPSLVLPALLALGLLGALAHPAWGKPRDGRDWSRESAREAPAWAREAVVYEVFPRAYSAAGTLNAVTAD
ncbi:MAG: hypothetical protein ACM3PV_04860, partial [Betaproteobacteria bacterium]